MVGQGWGWSAGVGGLGGGVAEFEFWRWCCCSVGEGLGDSGRERVDTVSPSSGERSCCDRNILRLIIG